MALQKQNSLRQCVDPLTCGIMVGTKVFSDLASYWAQQTINNRQKVQATVLAEGFVRGFWSKSPCSGTASIDWKYGEPQQILSQISYPNPNPKFCENSVAGLLERCNLPMASQLMQWLTQNMETEAQHDPTGGKYLTWFNQYGFQTVTDAQIALNRAASRCPAIPPSGSGGGGGGTGGGGFGFQIDTTMLLIIAAVALLFIMS